MAHTSTTAAAALRRVQKRVFNSGLISTIITNARGKPIAMAKASAKAICPIPHNVASDLFRSRSAEYSGWQQGETLKRITSWVRRAGPLTHEKHAGAIWRRLLPASVKQEQVSVLTSKCQSSLM